MQAKANTCGHPSTGLCVKIRRMFGKAASRHSRLASKWGARKVSPVWCDFGHFHAIFHLGTIAALFFFSWTNLIVAAVLRAPPYAMEWEPDALVYPFIWTATISGVHLDFLKDSNTSMAVTLPINKARLRSSVVWTGLRSIR
jgi:hypothetical protein